ncbi:bifunctional (p)ppGpp synthetase/guanosine-3',5'-bis(diphosphate) 3'-pyrophosphohydrolase [Candidatus Saccharibacteria bacterium]|nr:bifunctional (p)ppGpp synthetase/guanosine-3',5'-bis(diphosphate) 3'-pyrophosphohydrolase [Candidatus Saccharibacteria bacterium]NCU40219.1 bifunctional (p)ppGpp synthetase/guanosine-3',5'-bis(diphosphate) 3'-pyrophosphohydrolase [Candidatus Saccharibacteria bacterium]
MKKASLLELAKHLYDDDQLADLSSAIDYATELHAGQKRNSGKPYVSHTISVAAILVDWGMDIDTVIAGVLHDTIEDTDTNIDNLESLFGRDVAFLVDGVSKISKARAGMRHINSYLPETKDNLTKLLIAVGEDVRVIIIKLADRLHNMRTLKHLSPEKQQKIASETLEVFAPLADRLNMGQVRVELEEIAFRYIDPLRYEYLQQELKRRVGKSKRKLDKVRRSVEKRLKQEKIQFQMDGRVKSVYSLHKKLSKVDSIDDIYDLIALRIIVSDVDNCYLILSELHSLFEPVTERIKDYVSRPKRNGYQSLHTTVLTQDGLHVEFQVRTEQMHEYAERGLAAHFHYSEQKMTDAYRQGKIAEMPAELSWMLDLHEAATELSKGHSVDLSSLKIDLFGNRIFVFSPKGDIYDLPLGSYPLDYAYRVHSDVGASAAGFLINGKMMPFDYLLQDGDCIEIITKKTAKPKRDWLDTAATSHARNKIKAQINKLRV